MSKVGTGFRINGNQHMFQFNEEEIVKIEEQSYFNKNTQYINIVKGVECDCFLSPINNKEIIMIEVVYIIPNYFGDTSGHHWRTKKFVIIDHILYSEEGIAVKRIPREIKNALLENMKEVIS